MGDRPGTESTVGFALPNLPLDATVLRAWACTVEGKDCQDTRIPDCVDA